MEYQNVEPSENQEKTILPDQNTGNVRRRRSLRDYWIIITLVAFVSGSLGGFFVGRETHASMTQEGKINHADLVRQVNPPEGYVVPVKFGNIGPQLLEAGAMKADAFISVYEKAGQPLTEAQIKILKEGSDEQVVFTRENAYFLLNFFWALGLTNQNPVLEEGPMMAKGRSQVGNYASTGGWTLAAQPVTMLYASAPIITLTAEQQSRLEEVVTQVFRPCCDNPTHFPDCNHGMAMLGLMELLASQDASVDEMFEVAKYANAYWYPRQTIELAQFFKASQNDDFDEVDSKQLVSRSYSSISGFQQVHQWLTANGVLQQAPGGGSSCGV